MKSNGKEKQTARAKRLINKAFSDNMAKIRNDVLMSILSMGFWKRVEFAFRVISKKL